MFLFSGLYFSISLFCLRMKPPIQKKIKRIEDHPRFLGFTKDAFGMTKAEFFNSLSRDGIRASGILHLVTSMDHFLICFWCTSRRIGPGFFILPELWRLASDKISVCITIKPIPSWKHLLRALFSYLYISLKQMRTRYVHWYVYKLL